MSVDIRTVALAMEKGRARKGVKGVKGKKKKKEEEGEKAEEKPQHTTTHQVSTDMMLRKHVGNYVRRSKEIRHTQSHILPFSL